VLGPEKLPRVVSELGRWVGRARAMARQFREQLEEEVQLEEARKAQPMSPPPTPVAPPAAVAAPPEEPPPPPQTLAHAHPTDATGAEVTARTAPSASVDERRS
jgi:sec-independent protein translocase protein TatB